MFVTKIEIENFKCFKEKVSFDLEPNENQINLDIDKGYFIRRNPKDVIFSPIAAIGGANAKGKTSIFEAIIIFVRYFNKTMFEDFLSQILFEKKIHPDKMLIYYPAIFGNDKNIVLDSDDKILILEFKELLKKYYFDIFNLFSNDKTKEVKIKIFFGQNDENFVVKKFSVELLINKNGFFHNFYDFGSKIIANIGFVKKIETGVESFSKRVNFIKNDTNYMGDIINDNMVWPINRRIIYLENIISDGKLVNFLRLADPEIESINYLKDENGLIRNINHVNFKNGSQININSLSTGTQKFIKLLHYFYSLKVELENNNSEHMIGGLILIDEIETSLHHSLVNFFKKFIYKIAKNNDIQMFYTSHDPHILSSYVSNKQIFLIEDDEFEDKRKITKVSSSSMIRKHNNFVKKYLENKIGSHPSENDIDIELGEI